MKMNQNSELRIRFTGKVDARGKKIYAGYTSIPAHVDIQDTCMFFFPDEGTDGRFGGDLVIRLKDRDASKSREDDEEEEERDE